MHYFHRWPVFEEKAHEVCKLKHFFIILIDYWDIESVVNFLRDCFEL